MTQPYVNRFFRAAAKVWAELDSAPAREFIVLGYPRFHICSAAVSLADDWLAEDGASGTPASADCRGARCSRSVADCSSSTGPRWAEAGGLDCAELDTSHIKGRPRLRPAHLRWRSVECGRLSGPRMAGFARRQAGPSGTFGRLRLAARPRIVMTGIDGGQPVAVGIVWDVRSQGGARRVLRGSGVVLGAILVFAALIAAAFPLLVVLVVVSDVREGRQTSAFEPGCVACAALVRGGHDCRALGGHAPDPWQAPAGGSTCGSSGSASPPGP